MQGLTSDNGNLNDATLKEDPSVTSNAVSPPTINLPKGGGAVRGMGEKFAANPVTGTGSMSVPIATSPGRSGFGPQLSLSYDSGAGNGPFGFGWSLSLPSITRKTDKGLPQYLDAEESDVFILSGAEDMVPVYRHDPDGTWIASHPGFQRDADGFWVRDASGRLVVHEDEIDGYHVRRYRPRIEGLFARIERWTKLDASDNVHWRSISKDNVLTLYGFDANSRIADPLDASRIFSWLICETRDDKGNAVLYRYKAEDGLGVDLSNTHERNRGSQNDTRRTANRYLKRIHYGNRTSLLDNAGQRPRFPDKPQIDTQIANGDWMFEVVFDYDDHDTAVPKPNDDQAKDATEALKYPWKPRPDPFSTYRSGFEVRTTRLCQRVLMFHHFPGEASVGHDCLVRSTDFTYSDEVDPTNVRNPVYIFLQAVIQTGYRRSDGGYDKRNLPPVEFEYTQPIVQDTVEEVDAESLENLPIGLDGTAYQWTDLHGEGIPGILTEQAGGWYYKRNLSPISIKLDNGVTHITAKFAPIELAASKPNLTLASGAQFMDLAGDGRPDLVMLDGPAPGLYEHDGARSWQTFRPFTSRLNRDMRDPNLKFVDLNGDGHTDVLITEDQAFVWHPSLAEEGFGPAHRVAQATDEEKGLRLVFNDGTQSIYLVDLSGDGLSDLARIRNGEVCYWPNLGYGRFGSKVTMDSAPWFDNPDQFDQKRIRLADIDGSGTTDIIYLHREGVRLYFNQSGNSWSQPQVLKVFPRVDDLVSIMPTDLLGNGTACLVWSSPLSGDATRPMRYVNLMGNQKPHLLIKTVNNLGAETRVQYVSSTKFYLQDKYDGKPWITRLPFPVHVVECVETYDHISRNRFVTRYAYHHGYFDGEEREFRGFGMVEQWDTEEIGQVAPGETSSEDTNLDEASFVPPVLTKTWFHTGAYLGRDHISNFFAGLLDERDTGEYYRESGLTDIQARTLLLPDTTLPDGVTVEEEREACRALKGSMLRQEVYALDDTDKAEISYTVTEQNFTIRRLQPHDGNRHAVFFSHPRETISYHYERNPADPRISHALTLEVDEYGNVLKEAAIGYGRREHIRIVEADGQVREIPNPELNKLEQDDQEKQTQSLVTYSENDVTNAIDLPLDDPDYDPDNYRTPLPCEARTYELTGYTPTGTSGRFQADDFVEPDSADPSGRKRIHIFDGEVDYEDEPPGGRQRRLIERLRTLYRPDDLGVSPNDDPLALLPSKKMGTLALAGETYKLAFTPGLLDQVYVRDGQNLLWPSPADVLEGSGGDKGGYIDLDNDGCWWIPSGRIFYSSGSNDDTTTERAEAQSHFYLPRRYRDPFHSEQFKTESFVDYDTHDLLVLETRDALGNRVTSDNNYRVLQPALITDPNRNRSAVAFDTLGMVVGMAVMGKPEENPLPGDRLDPTFLSDLTQAQTDQFFTNPTGAIAATLLDLATTRIIYDLEQFHRTRAANPDDPTQWQPPYAATLARETHVSDLQAGQQTKIQISFSYSDGFGREIQKKIQAEAGEVEVEDAAGNITVVDTSPNLRWVGSGWTIFNNKGKPVRQYEPFFSIDHQFQFGEKVGVSPVLFYDPAERIVATLHPNHTYEKVVFDPWQQMTYDVNDTLKFDPKNDDTVHSFFTRLPDTDYLPSWYDRMRASADVHERSAAQRTEAHADTPTIAHFDALGRPFLTIADNGTQGKYETRVELDIEGNQRRVTDARGNVVMNYDYDMLGERIKQTSMEAGTRWMLNNVAGKPIRAWDDRDFTRRMTYDALQRPTGLYVTEPTGERLAEQTIYGEDKPAPTDSNHRGQVWQVRDDAGIVTSETYDFKGNLLHSKRDLRTEYKVPANWAQLPLPATSETFTSSSKFDALNRVIESVTPDGSVTVTRYNDANLLETVDVGLRGAAVTPFVRNIDYDAKGQRIRIEYNKDSHPIITEYRYDRDTFRLIQLITTRPKHPEANKRKLQDLHYTYDPVGNITHIQDDAQPRVFFDNACIDASNNYCYDALYRLIAASGREHKGQDLLPNWDDSPRMGNPIPYNCTEMRHYVETYRYDAVGNIMQMVHHTGAAIDSPGVVVWNRRYQYRSDNNMLRCTSVPGEAVLPDYADDPAPQQYGHRYTYDAHGNMVTMPHLPSMRWDFKDQLTEVDLLGGGTAYYIYDASGQRVRKVWEKSANLIEERIYLGGFEIFRQRNGVGAIWLERETLHIKDDKQRIALIETRTFDMAGNDPAPQQLIRYQFSNHLGSASLELDDQGQIISYEEYTSYGNTSYQAVRNQTETPKRYRYTGKERDDESGLNYHGARYYSAWVGKWISPDKHHWKDGCNAFAYVESRPVIMVDPDGNDGVEWRGMFTMGIRFGTHENRLYLGVEGTVGVHGAGLFAEGSVQFQTYPMLTHWSQVLPGWESSIGASGAVGYSGESSDDFNTRFEIGTTYFGARSFESWSGSGGPLTATDQRVGHFQLTLGTNSNYGEFRMHNDGALGIMPGGGTDAFRTAGFELTFTHRDLEGADRNTFRIGLGLELITGDVDRDRRIPEPGANAGEAYDQRGLAFEDLSVGALYGILSFSRTEIDPIHPEFGFELGGSARVGGDTEGIRQFFQNDLVHDMNNIPWVPTSNRPGRGLLDVDLHLNWSGDTELRP